MFFHLLLFVSFSKIFKDRNLSISTNGNWPNTPLLAEASTFIADVDGEAFWTFLRGLQKFTDEKSNQKSKSHIPQTIEEIKSYSLDFLSEEQRYLLELSLLTRSYSPRIEMFRQIASNYKSNQISKSTQDSSEFLDFNQIKTFAVFSNEIYLTIEELNHTLTEMQNGERRKSRPIVFPFEPRFGRGRDTILLYCPIDDPLLFSYLNLFQSFELGFSFVYRPISSSDCPVNNKQQVQFRGYGFEARPFNYSMMYSTTEDQKEFASNSQFESPDSELIKRKRIIPGSVWPNFTTLPTQLIQFCKTTSDPFATLLEVAENFPIFATNISKMPVIPSITEKINEKPERVIAGASAMYVNGRLIKSPDVYHILQDSLDELRIGQMLREHYGLTKSSLDKALHLLPESAPTRKVVIDYRSSFMYSLNDIETGKAYQNWTSSLTTLMTSSIPNQRIRRNLFNAVFLIDPVDTSDLKILTWMEEQIRLSAPFRFSYFVTPRNNSRFAKRVLYGWAHIRLKYGPEKAHQFLLNAKKIHENEISKDDKSGSKVKETHFRTAYQSFVSSKSPRWQSLDELFSPKTRESKHIRKMRNHLEHLGVSGPGLFFNGKFYPGKRGDKNIQQYFIESLPRLRKLYSIHRFADKKNKASKRSANEPVVHQDTIDQIFTGDEVYTRFNPLVQHRDKSPSEFIPLIMQSYHFQKDFMNWVKSLRYNFSAKATTTTSKMSRDNIKFATFWMFIGEDLSHSMESRYIASEIEHYISKMMPEDGRFAFFCDGGLHKIAMNAMPPPFVQDLLQLKPDEITILLNGRVIRMKGRTIYDWTAEDFEVLLKWEYHRSISMVKSFFTNEGDVEFNYDVFSDYDIDSIDSSFHSQLALYLSFIYGYSSHNDIVRFPIDITGIYSGSFYKDNSGSRSSINKNVNVDIKSPVIMNYENDDSTIEYSLILNPLEIEFQKMAPIVKYLRDSKAFSVRIYLNFDKDSERKEFPTNLKGFHRFLLSDFSENPKITFDRFDSDIIYSIIPHVPENWMIVPTEAKFDLDNFKAKDIQPGSSAVANYRLSSILVEGSALDESYIPVHGLRIVLNMDNISQFDHCRKRGRFESLSIKTMGYFQLQSQPGIWKITLGEGPTQLVYNISSDNTMIVNSFVPSWITMLVYHNDGMSRYSIYNLPKEYRLMYNNNTSNGMIHVFAVVSGHLYEDLVKIMMVSVLKNTKSKVKFWFLQNFISAQFKEDLKVMAEKYSFDFDFVEYHWPQWIPRQNDRQKVIWGNKILFIDALFPTNLSRVIYIDADAVVRGDLMRLMKMDLKGMPYGFVPFCTSRKEMSKYHFWTKGYWKKHLGSTQKYHISAMFVVDLDRYRRMGAGDKLRTHYKKIVGNKQSLQNLDQDLPNDAQDEVPIYSLPKKWLWCCTWCSEYEKDDAMIIDLANNPKTKMPKVEMAKKFIEEWPLLKLEADNFRNSSFFVSYNLSKIRQEHRVLTGNEKTPRPKRTKKPSIEYDGL